MAILDQSFTTAPDQQNYLRYDAASRLAQQFTPATTNTVSSVDLLLYKAGTPTGNINAEIWSDTGSNLPNAQIGSNSGNVDVSTLTTNTAGAYVTFTFATPVPTTAGTKYWIVLDGDYTISDTNHAAWKRVDAGGYTGGIMAFYDGASWNSTTFGTTTDYNFKQYGDEIPTAGGHFYFM